MFYTNTGRWVAVYGNSLSAAGNLVLYLEVTDHWASLFCAVLGALLAIAFAAAPLRQRTSPVGGAA